MNIAELSRIDRSIDIVAPPERVYRALTDPAELAAWFKVSIEGLIAAEPQQWHLLQPNWPSDPGYKG